MRYSITSVRGALPAAERSSYSEVSATCRLTGACTTWVPTPRLRTSMPLSTSSWMPWRTVGRDSPSRLDSAISFSRRLPGGSVPQRTESSIARASCRYSGVVLSRSIVRSSVIIEPPPALVSTMLSPRPPVTGSPQDRARRRSAPPLVEPDLHRAVGREGLHGRRADGRRQVAVPGGRGAGGDVRAVGDGVDPGLHLGVVGGQEAGPEVQRHGSAPAAAGLLRGHPADVQADGG